MTDDEQHFETLLSKASDGDQTALQELFSRHRKALVRMVKLRMDPRLSGRVDASDIIQEATLTAAQRLPEYAQNPDMDFFLWLRWLVNDKLIDAHRFHLGAQKRQVGQEISIFHRPVAEATSFVLAEHLLGRIDSPSEHVRRHEAKIAIQEALNRLEPVDREVLVLRHFENLTNKQTAEVLGIKKSGASRRYVVALQRLKSTLESIPIFEHYFSSETETKTDKQ